LLNKLQLTYSLHFFAQCKYTLVFTVGTDVCRSITWPVTWSYSPTQSC